MRMTPTTMTMVHLEPHEQPQQHEQQKPRRRQQQAHRRRRQRMQRHSIGAAVSTHYQHPHTGMLPQRRQASAAAGAKVAAGAMRRTVSTGALGHLSRMYSTLPSLAPEPGPSSTLGILGDDAKGAFDPAGTAVLAFQQPPAPRRWSSFAPVGRRSIPSASRGSVPALPTQLFTGQQQHTGPAQGAGPLSALRESRRPAAQGVDPAPGRDRLRRRASCPSMPIAKTSPSRTPNARRSLSIAEVNPQPPQQRRRRSSLVPNLPGIPAAAAAVGINAQSESTYVSCWNVKPLHDRGERASSEKRGPLEKVYQIVEREHSNVRVIRVGGGFVILTEEIERYLANRGLGDLMSGASLESIGRTIKGRKPDGSLVLDDGSVVRPDGARVLDNGMALKADGTCVDADGNVIADPHAIAKFNETHSTALQPPSTPQSQRSPGAGSRPSSRGVHSSSGYKSLSASQHLAESQDAFPDTSKANNTGCGSSLGADADKMPPGGGSDGLSGSGSRSRRHSRRMSWDFSSEVASVLGDGTKVLEDGTHIHSDGSISLADGTKLPPGEAQEFARKRKLGRWPKRKKKKKGPGGDHHGAEGASIATSGVGSGHGTPDVHSHHTSRRHSRRDSIDGLRGKKLGLSGGDEDDGIGPPTGCTQSRRRMRRFPESDPYGFDAGKDISAHLRTPQSMVNPLDYLSRYCILTKEQLKHYRMVFDNLDRDKDGIISQVELEFGVKTVNKHVITSRELDYVNVVLELQHARELSFRMFALVCALSERVVGLDLFVRGLINQMDSRALMRKIVGCRDLFYLLDEKGAGAVAVDDLSSELIAGRISKQHEAIVIDQFTEDGEVTFLDFLTYIPLFVEIHDTINNNPFETTRDK